MLSPGLSTHSSNQTFSPSARNRSASGRSTALPFALWLRKTSYSKAPAFMANGLFVTLLEGFVQAEFHFCSRPSLGFLRQLDG